MNRPLGIVDSKSSLIPWVKKSILSALRICWTLWAEILMTWTVGRLILQFCVGCIRIRQQSCRETTYKESCMSISTTCFSSNKNVFQTPACPSEGRVGVVFIRKLGRRMGLSSFAWPPTAFNLELICHVVCVVKW